MAEVFVFFIMLPCDSPERYSNSLASVRHWYTKVSLRDTQRHLRGKQVL